MKLRQRLAGVVSLFALLTIIAGGPIFLSSFDVTIVALLAWISWALFTACVIGGVVARSRGTAVVAVPGLGPLQELADRLLGATRLIVLPQPAGSAGPASTAVPSHDKVPRAKAPKLEKYVVRVGDSLWSIAEGKLGDGRRYSEIVGLNEDALSGQPEFLPVGLSLLLPPTHAEGAEVEETTPADPPTGPTVEIYIVRPGDTLVSIAEDRLGDGARYPEMMRASRDILQPGGERLQDTDTVVKIGWKIAIPRGEMTGGQEPT